MWQQPCQWWRPLGLVFYISHWISSSPHWLSVSRDCFWVRVRSGKFILKINIEWKISPKNGLFWVTKLYYQSKQVENWTECHQTPHISYCFLVIHVSAIQMWILKESHKNFWMHHVSHHLGEWKTILHFFFFLEKSGILLLLGCHFSHKFPNTRALLTFYEK